MRRLEYEKGLGHLTSSLVQNLPQSGFADGADPRHAAQPGTPYLAVADHLNFGPHGF